MTTEAPQQQAAPPRKNMWEEGFVSFKRNFKEWLPSALIFGIATAAVGLFLAQGVIDVLATVHADKHAKIHIPKGAGVAALLAFLLIWIQSFYFLIFYAKKELPYGKAEMTVGRFFYVLGCQIVVMFLCFMIGAVGSIGAFVLKKAVGNAAGVLFNIVVYGVYYYIVVRLFLVYPLSANAIKPVLETSWNLVKGNWWRLFLNYLLFAVIIGLASLLPFGGVLIGCVALYKSAPNMQMIGIMGVAVAGAIYLVVNISLITAFIVSAARILIDEKRQSDPSFLSPKQA